MSRSRRRKEKCICKYRNFTDKDGTLYRLPMVPVRVEHEGVSFRTAALVDSGANSTFIPYDFIEILGLKIDGESSARGAGGLFPTYLSRVNIDVLKGVRSIHTFQDCEVQIAKDNVDIPMVLGRDTIFEEFEITFRERDEKILLRSY